jgi:hypothetical protein
MQQAGLRPAWNAPHFDWIPDPEPSRAPSRSPPPARLRALRLHGKYFGYLRHLKPRQKAGVRALRARKGVKAAIKRARKLAGR